MEKRTGIVSMKDKPLTLIGKRLKEGDPAPDFEVLDNDLSPIRFASFQGKAEEPGEKQENKKKKNIVEDLPYCTRAPSAEHMRSNEEDEPCDDGRAGSVEED